MSRLRKLEEVLDLYLTEDHDTASKNLHHYIVERARDIYESIIDEEEKEQTVGGEPDEDFTSQIASDSDDIDTDELKGGEAGEDEDEFDSEEDEEDDEDEEDEEDDEDEEEDEFDSEEDSEEDLEDRVDSLQAEIDELRAQFDALMDEEMQEPQHADLPSKMGGMSSMGGMGDQMAMEDNMEEMSHMYEKKKHPKMEVAPQEKKKAKGKRADEETQFMTKVADTGQKGTAKLVGAGTNSKLGAENTQAPFTRAPSKKDYGGGPVDFTRGTGGEYGKYHGDSAKDDTPSDNTHVEPKKSSIKADSTAKYTGGKAAGEGFNKSPLTKKPR